MDIKQSLVTNNLWWKNEKINSKFLLGRKRNEFETGICQEEWKMTGSEGRTKANKLQGRQAFIMYVHAIVIEQV